MLRTPERRCSFYFRMSFEDIVSILIFLRESRRTKNVLVVVSKFENIGRDRTLAARGILPSFESRAQIDTIRVIAVLDARRAVLFVRFSFFGRPPRRTTPPPFT